MKLSKPFLINALLCFAAVPSLKAQQYNIIPYPASLHPKEGTFIINKQTTLAVTADAGLFKNEANFLRQMIGNSLGTGALRQNNKAAANMIVLAYDPAVTAPEGYTLSVDPKSIVLKAGTPAGMFHAMETLRQLLPAGIETGGSAPLSTLPVPAVEIADQPAFEWRGMMLDVSRHFFSVAYVKRYLDLMALYKLNRLHLHLTDDQGWRIEIKKYPRLTAESGWRTFNDQDSASMRTAKETGNPDFQLDPAHIRQVNGRTEYGGFYTQEQMKDIIRYAASRHIEIIPEIDMPGHMMAAVALYPWLTCDGTQGQDWRRGFSNPICPCKDSSMQFAKDVLSEIFQLFPSRYIHIGGDEVEKRDWEKSPLCQAFMREHNIKNLDALQSYFNDRLLEFFHAHGKTLLGWDEIVEGGIDSSAAVMFWRPWARMSPLKATSNGNKVIMSPDGPLYFDAWPDRNTLTAVYHYNPTDTMYEMNEAQQQNIIGVQANLWSEMVPSEGRADYLTMPRMTALAELGWTHQDLYDSYLARLEGQYDRLDRLHISYRLPDLPEVADNRVFIDTTSFFTTAPSSRFTIRYTLDGTNPGPSSPALTTAIPIDRSLTFKMAAFTAAGRRGDVSTLAFDRQAYATPVTADAAQQGLECRLFKGAYNKTTAIKATADSVLQTARAAAPAGINLPEFGLRFTGYIDVPEAGIYSFFLTSNDGSVLHIGGRLVVDNDGLHSDREKSGQVALGKGLQPFALDFIEAGGGYSLDLKYSKDNEQPQPIPESWFKH
jgi:hexosaminidase